MKVYTIEYCGECPSYIPDHSAYYDEYGECGRDRTIKVNDNRRPPEFCPLKDFVEVNEKHKPYGPVSLEGLY